MLLESGGIAGRIAPDGNIYCHPDDKNSAGARELHHRTAGIAQTVREYMIAMENAPALKVEELDEYYRLLCSFGDVVLAGWELADDRGYHFTTWRGTYDKTGVANGNYYMEKYEQAKEDFSIRAGLMERVSVNDKMNKSGN